MDHKQLRCFIAAAEARSFSAASADLHLAPSALSRHISNLEREIGVVLFERTRGGRVRLTEQGARLLPGAREVAHTLDRFALQARQEAAGALGSVTIASVDWVGPVLLPRVVERVKAVHPRLHIKLSAGSWAQVLRDALEGAADLAIMPDEIVEARLEVVMHLRSDVLLVSPAGEAPFGESCSMRDVLSLPVIAPPRGSGESGMLMDIARSHGVEPDIVLEADLALWPRLVRRGEGHVAIPALAVRQELQLDGLSCSTISDLHANWSVVRRPDRGGSVLASVVIDAMRQEARQLGL